MSSPKSLFDQLMAFGAEPEGPAEQGSGESMFDALINLGDPVAPLPQQRPRSKAGQPRKPPAEIYAPPPIDTASGVGRQLLRLHDPRRDPAELVGLDTFAGALGFTLGAQRAGLKTVGVEKDPLAVRTGRQSGRVVAQLDVADVADSRVPVDILIGGPPCQPFSSAGRRRGQYDPREGFQLLMPVLDAAKPRRMVVENVAAFLEPRYKAYRDQIMSQLRKRFRYVGAWRLDAKSFGVPQDRKRVFIWGAERKLSPPKPTHGPGTRRPYASVGQALPHLEREGYDAIMPFQTTARARSTDRPGFTITTRRNAYAVMGTHWRYAGAGSVPKGKRRILRPDETLIIQAFPEGFAFAGALQDQQCQIGNAVPPPLAAAVVGAVKSGLKPRKLLPEELMDAFSVIDESIWVLEPRPWVDKALIGVLVDPPYLGRPGIIPIYDGTLVRDAAHERAAFHVKQQLTSGQVTEQQMVYGVAQEISSRALDWLHADKTSHYMDNAPRVLPLQLFRLMGVPMQRVFEVFAQGDEPFRALLISNIMQEAWPTVWERYRGSETDLGALHAFIDRHGLNVDDLILEGLAEADTMYN